MALTSACGMVAGHHVAGCWCCCCWEAGVRTGGALDSRMVGKVNMALTSASGIYTRKKIRADDVISGSQQSQRNIDVICGSSPVLRCEAVGILTDGSTGHGEGWAVAIDWEDLLVGRACAGCYRLLDVHWMPPWRWVGYMGVWGGGLLTQWVGYCCAGGATRRDWCGGGS